MPYHDLNVIHQGNASQLNHTLAFATELGYRTLAIATVVTGSLPSKPDVADLSVLRQRNPTLTLLTRLTLHISDHSQNHSLSQQQSTYDIIALRPLNEKSLQHCCSTLDCDLISLDLSQRLPFLLKFPTVSSAITRGVRFEICYSPITGSSDAKRNLIAGATTLIRATRGRGIILSSEAKSAFGLRGPHDVMNLAQIWGLEQAKGKEGLVEEAGKVVRLADLKRKSYRGVITVVDDGRPTQSGHVVALANTKGQINSVDNVTSPAKAQAHGVKRKASSTSLGQSAGLESGPVSSTNGNTPNDSAVDDQGKPLSKRQQKRQAKKAKSEARGSLGANGNSQSAQGVASNGFPIQHETLAASTKKEGQQQADLRASNVAKTGDIRKSKGKGRTNAG
jgi:ribonuclease P/MRP protein subunit RPP1